MKRNIRINITIKSSRKLILSYDISFSSFSELLSSIRTKIESIGIQNIQDNKIHSIDGTPLNSNNYKNFIVDNSIDIIYDNIIAPYGAYEYDRVGGLVFFFHTAENCHKKFPHIHVRYSGEEISIYLLTNRIVGKFSNKKMLKFAAEYVAKNVNQLLVEWNRITS